MSKLMQENEFLIEEARERYAKLTLFIKQQAGPVLLPLMLAVENLTKAVSEIEKLKNPAQPGKGDGYGA